MSSYHLPIRHDGAHLTQNEIEEAIKAYVVVKSPFMEGATAKIIVELGTEDTGDPRDQPFTVVKRIRAEVESK